MYSDLVTFDAIQHCVRVPALRRSPYCHGGWSVPADSSLISLDSSLNFYSASRRVFHIHRLLSSLPPSPSTHPGPLVCSAPLLHIFIHDYTLVSNRQSQSVQRCHLSTDRLTGRLLVAHTANRLQFQSPAAKQMSGQRVGAGHRTMPRRAAICCQSAAHSTLYTGLDVVTLT